MTVLVLDDFSRLAEGESLGSKPTPAPTNTPGNSWTAVSACTGATGGGKLAIGLLGTCELDVGTPTGSFAFRTDTSAKDIRASIRVSGTNGYAMFVRPNAAICRIYRVDSGVPTTLLDSFSSGTLTGDDVYKVKVFDPDASTVRIEVYVNGVLRGSVDDTSASRKTSGNRIGFYIEANSAVIDDVTFDDETGGGGPPYTLTADPATFTETGVAAGLKATRRIAAAVGSFVLTGQDVTLSGPGAKTLVAETGAFTLTGGDVGFEHAVPFETAAFVVTGYPATLTYTPAEPVEPVSYTLTAEAGAYTLTGIAVILSTTANPWSRVPRAAGTWTRVSR